MTKARVTCPDCNKQIAQRVYARHRRACLAIPENGEVVIRFLHEYADDGYIMLQFEYQDFAAETPELPSLSTLVKTIGSWRKVADWAGLRVAPRRPRQESWTDDEMGTADPDLPTEAHWLSAIPAHRTVRAWDVTARSWRPVAVATAWLLR